MTNLADLIPALRREVSPPGEDLFPNASDDDFLGYLLDGAWEAKLDGFLADYTLDNNTYTVTPDLPDFYKYLIVLWAGVRITRTRLSNLRTSQKSVAGPVSFEYSNSAMVLSAVLKEIMEKKKRLIELSYRITDVTMIDGYFQRDFNDVHFIRPDF